MFNSAGLSVEHVKPLIFRENDTIFLRAMARACSEAGIDYDEASLLPFQYIVLAEKKQLMADAAQ